MDGLTAFINDAPLLLIAGLVFFAQCLMREAGGWIRRRVSAGSRRVAEEVSDKGYLLSGVLGLLALLIAFTFGLAVDRYEGRRHLVTEEANAISTAEMRVQLLPSPDGARLATCCGTTPGHARRTASPTRRTGRRWRARPPPGAAHCRPLRSRLWPRWRPRRWAPFVGASINSVLDIGVEREAMNDARVPLTILRGLVFYALLTAAILGYGLTGARARHRATTVMLFTLLTLAIVLILDLDRPQGGTIRIDQTPMTQLVAGFPPGTTGTESPQPSTLGTRRAASKGQT
jgi:hypothetical protein